TLNREGILESRKGIGGGFILSRKPSSIYLLDLMEAFQGTFKLNECLFKRKLCPDRNRCWLKRKIGSIEDSVLLQLKTVTIGSLLG
ncbi:MAG: Rrf2 family transcriptional regulator, partial [Candidatus Omnitrophica bacterium]|nr:Rrf2 family transcriptional regulator [Candidatus Omnitrophota bacterium]